MGAPLGRLLRKANTGFERFFDPAFARVVSLEPKGTPRGRVLLAYKIEGWVADADDPAARKHNHFVEGRLLPQVFLDLGYGVDFISHLNHRFRPRRKYDIFFGSRTYMERIASRLDPGCLRIVHLDTAHWLYNNTAALERLQEVRDRRHAALPSYTPIEINRAIEAADCATMLGSEFDYETYAFAGKRVFQMPNPMSWEFPWIEGKDFEACRRRFLWFGSSGLVHKGLDIVLEAFAAMPEMHLTVCGPIAQDQHFTRAFHRELFETPNIHTHGWIDIASQDFIDVARGTVALVYASCADACCGSVVNCMGAGLIPLVSRAAGVELGPGFGTELEAVSVEAVQAAVRRIAGTSADRLEVEARATWEYAQATHSHDRYKQVLAGIIEQVVAEGRDGLARPGFVRMDA